ncbi:MAG: hypothetical protein HOW73_44445 [Polyangiaceae bacterium]|nr:hypothetical protein [Polyangiaceae bacterium]
MTRRFAWLPALALFSVALPAAAQSEKTSEQLFLEAKADVQAGRLDEACPKFEASHRVSQNVGALLSWADCEEQRGRLATALRLWEDGGRRVANETDRRDYVASRINALKPRVPAWTISVGNPAAQNAKITIDGKAIQLGSDPVLVDPGDHIVTATADGMKAETKTVQAVESKSETVVVFAPAAETTNAPSRPIEPRPEAPTDSSASTLKIAGWITGAIGLGGAAAFGATAGVIADRCDLEGTNADGEPLDGNGCPSGSQGLLVGNAVTLGVGIAGLGVGVGLLIAGFTQKSGSEDVAIVAGPGDVGIGIAWSFGRP